jgi:hypothetical protein
MGSYINVGIVYSDSNLSKFNNDLQFMVKYLSQFSDEILINYPQNENLEIWEEAKFEGEKGLIEAFTILNTKKMSSGKMCVTILNNNYNILVSIKGDSSLFKGILLEIQEEDLLQEDYSSDNLDRITKKIANILISLWNDTDFSYAFCDSDADIEYPLMEVEQSKEPIYSLLILKNNLYQPNILLSSWCIDGITQREQ